MSFKSKIGALVSRNGKDPSDFVFTEEFSAPRYYIFERGSIGMVVRDDCFDITGYVNEDEIDDGMYGLIDDWYDGLLEGDKKKMVEDFLKDLFGGKMPLGSIFIDKWYPYEDDIGNGSGSYPYFNGETLGDWCNRNGECQPIMEAPEEAINLLGEGDFEGLWEFLDGFLKSKEGRR